ncbi:MAG: hypothetical protein RMK29_13015 [Myxococcales bacterium]|nr:hypothetical protein [Myxococcota bacterium]MDW8282626.1 hypothetical protein [Myxococcales bacterium]
MIPIAELLAQRTLDLPAIAHALDTLDKEARLRVVMGLGRRQQAALFEAAAGHRPITLEDLVPPDTPPLVEVVHEGKNSLVAFRRFAKVFCRPDGDLRDELWGYNRCRPLIAATVGPGYFIARAGAPGEVLIDYLRVPPRKPESWPQIVPNRARLGRFVYDQMQDILRGISRHVSVGRATKNGRSLDAWFLLCRMQ